MFCKKCGTKISRGATECQCGAPISLTVPSEISAQRKSGVQLAFVAVGFLIPIVAFSLLIDRVAGGNLIRQPQRQVSAQVVTGDGFAIFYSRLRTAVRARNPSALGALMSDHFEWAEDGFLPRDQALRNIGTMIGWSRFWQSADRIVSTNPEPCGRYHCNNREGYHASTATPVPIEMVFERGPDQEWHWTAVLGD